MSLAAQENQSNQHFWYTLESDATPHQIWTIWTDVANWHQWDSGLKAAEMQSPFQLNATGIITSLEGRKSKFKIVELEEGTTYTFKTKLPLGSLYVKRYLEQKNEKTYFTHEVWFQGLTKGIFAKAFGKKFKAMLPEVMQSINQIAIQNDTY